MGSSSRPHAVGRWGSALETEENHSLWVYTVRLAVLCLYLLLFHISGVCLGKSCRLQFLILGRISESCDLKLVLVGSCNMLSVVFKVQHYRHVLK